MIITIARQCGCGALHIGEQLSQYYDIPFYTRKNLLELAQKRGVLQEMDDFFEERPVDELMFAISQFDEEPQNVNIKAFSVLSKLIGHEDCIIIGRCGNVICKDREDLVSICLKGNFNGRVKAIEAENNMNTEEAITFVNELDESRVRYHKYYTGMKWGDANDYDLCFDSIRLGTTKSADFIEKYIEEINLK